MIRALSLLVSAGVGALLLAPDAVACLTCVGWTKDGPIWSGGFVWSTLLLMGTPFLLAGLIGGWLYLAYRRARRSREETRRSSTFVWTQEETSQWPKSL